MFMSGSGLVLRFGLGWGFVWGLLSDQLSSYHRYRPVFSRRGTSGSLSKDGSVSTEQTAMFRRPPGESPGNAAGL